MDWKALLDGPLASRAWTLVLGIAEELEAAPPAQSPSYALGDSGTALFYGYLAAVTGEQRFSDISACYLESASDSLGREPLRLGLLTGLTGLAWANQHLSQLLTGHWQPEMNQEIDGILSEILQQSPWPWEYDLTDGVAGFACYALDHPSEDRARDLLTLIVDRLDESAVERADGTTWLTPPDLLPPAVASRYPRGVHDMGVAHGVPGILGTLARTYRAAALPKAHRLVKAAVQWLLANRRPSDGGSTFGRYAAYSDRYSCRSAWCYGDPGVAASLLLAARTIGESRWEDVAIEIARKDCARSIEESGAVDASLCHGTAGLGHLYNRMFQTTGLDVFHQAARLWLDRTINWLEALRTNSRSLSEATHGEAGLLEGIAGTGLALLAALGGPMPDWDKPMNLSIPGTRGADSQAPPRRS